MRATPGSIILFVSSTNELPPSIHFLTQNMTPMEACERVRVDYFSFNTVDNAARTFAQLELYATVPLGTWKHTPPRPHPPAWVLHVLTNDWHLPRSMVIFLSTLNSLHPDGEHSITLLPCPVPTPFSVLMYQASLTHLFDSRYHVPYYFDGSGRSDALRNQFTLEEHGQGGLFALRDLLSVGRNLRAWTVSQSAAAEVGSQAYTTACAELAGKLLPLLRALRDVPAAANPALGYRDHIFMLLCDFSFKRPLRAAPTLRLNVHGSTALHFAAEAGERELCLDLMCWFGYAAYATNARGLDAAGYADKTGHTELAALLRRAALIQREHDQT
jgi:hypothetical protein